MDYFAAIQELPVPSEAQIRRFQQHLLEVHSWYKHLPLLQGAEFVIFLEQDLDREYPSQHPSLPFGNTAHGYQRAFGHLWYRWTDGGHPGEDFASKRVNGERISLPLRVLPPELEAAGKVILRPYCHSEFANGYSRHEEDFRKIRAGEGSHLPRKKLLRWEELFLRHEGFWEEKFNEEDIDMPQYLQDIPIKHLLHDTSVPEVVREFLQEWYQMDKLSADLQRKEYKKVGQAIEGVLRAKPVS